MERACSHWPQSSCNRSSARFSNLDAPQRHALLNIPNLSGSKKIPFTFLSSDFKSLDLMTDRFHDLKQIGTAF